MKFGAKICVPVHVKSIDSTTFPYTVEYSYDDESDEPGATIEMRESTDAHDMENADNVTDVDTERENPEERSDGFLSRGTTTVTSARRNTIQTKSIIIATGTH